MKISSEELRKVIEDNITNKGRAFSIASKLRTRPNELRLFNAFFDRKSARAGGVRLYTDSDKNLLTIVDNNVINERTGKRGAFRTVNCNDLAWVAVDGKVLYNDVLSYKGCTNYDKLAEAANKIIKI